jgi:hypothetical protein
MTKTLRRAVELISGAAGVVTLIAVLVAPVGAATLPSAVTGPPSAVSFTGATVSGDLNANGLVTSWAFQYGNTSALGLSTAFDEVGATPASEVPVSAGLTGLTPGTTYYYRLVAKNADGTAYGAEASLHTLALAPTISKTSISAVSDTSSQVDVEINPHGLSTTWAVRYGTTSNFGSWSADRSAGSGVGVVNVAVALNNLSRDTQYLVQAVATNAVGTHDGAVMSFSTSGAPAVVSQSSDILSPTEATLTGGIHPNGHPTRWYFQYGPSTSYGLRTTIESARSSLGSVAVAHTVVGLTPNTTYQFRLVAVNADGTAVGANATFVMPGPTLSVSSLGVIFGGKVTISGSVPNHAANEAITLYADATPDPSFVAVATVLTGVGGSWAYEIKPRIATSYKAVWKGEVSPTAAVQVRPRLFLERRRNGALFTRMYEGGASLAGRLVRLQRLEHGYWRNVAARRLNRDGFATFRTGVTPQFATLRAYLTAYQAGPGYLASWSASHRFRI